MSKIYGAAILLCSLVSRLVAQDSPRFEVATVKPSDPNAPRGGTGKPKNGLVLPNGTLRALITDAYRDQLGIGVEIEGGPAWINKDRFDVVADAAEPVRPAKLSAMLRQLLADRFALKVHTETREQQVFALIQARRDGKLGPKVKPWDGTCPNNAAPQLQGGELRARCSAFFRPPGIEIFGGSMVVVANLLSGPQAKLGRRVVDRTGISGEFDMKLEFDFYADDPRNPNRLALTEPLGVSLFRAIEEQWGLKLTASKDNVTVLVVDSASPPTEN